MFKFSIFDLRKYIFANLLSLLAYIILFFTIFVFVLYPFVLYPIFDLFFENRIQLETIYKIYIYYYFGSIVFFVFFILEFLICIIRKKTFLKLIENKKKSLIYTIFFYIGIGGIIWFEYLIIYTIQFLNR